MSGGGGEAKAAGEEEEQPKEISSTPGGLEIPRRRGAGQAAPGTPRAPASPRPRRDRDQARAEQMDQEDAEIARSASSWLRPMQGPMDGGTRMEVTAEEAEASAQKREPEAAATERLKIGGVVAATLYRHSEAMEHYEEYDAAWEAAEGYEEDGAEVIHDQGDPAEEIAVEGKGEELKKMDKYATYEPRPAAEAKGKKILDSTWVVTVRPDGRIKCRYCLRDLQSKSTRDDVFAVASSEATARVIDTIGVKKGYVFFTMDAENAFWQVPIDEECYMYPAEEWLEERRRQGLPTDGCGLEAAQGVVRPEDCRAEVCGLGGGARHGGGF